MITLVAVVVVATLCLVRYVQYRIHFTSLLAKMAGPAYPLPGIGHLLRMFGPMDAIMARGLKLYYEFGPGPVKFWIGETPSIQLTRPEDIEPILNSQKEVEKPELFYKPVRGFFGLGLITLNGEDWFTHRRALTPAFHFSVLERYAGIFARRGAAFANKLSAEVPAGKSFNIMKLHSAFVTETIMETAFGMPPEATARDTRDVKEFVRAAEEGFAIIVHRIFHPWLLIDPIFKLSGSGRVQARCDAVIERYAKRVIASKKALLKQRQAGGSEDAAEDDGDDGVRKKYTFLDMALGSGAGTLSDKEILEEVRTLIAVQQTSAASLSFVMVMLALNPEVQEAARREVLEVDANHKGLHPLDRLKKFRYLERVVKETLRLYPIVAVFSRNLHSEVHLPDHTLPAGVLATMFVFLTHRDRRHWPDPERFDPDRFLPDNCVGRHPYAYVPFSAGPRNCIGQRYAMLQIKAVIAAVLAKFVVLPGQGCESRDKLRLNMDTFLYIIGGFNVRLQPLQKSAVVNA